MWREKMIEYCDRNGYLREDVVIKLGKLQKSLGKENIESRYVVVEQYSIKYI